MNKSILIGRLVRDLELSYTAGKGTAVAKGTLAVDRTFKKEGEPEADFINIVLFGKQAENTAQFCGTKGALLGVSGRIQNGQFTSKKKDEDGKPIIRYTTDIIVDDVQWLNTKNRSTPDVDNGFDGATLVNDDDTPF